MEFVEKGHTRAYWPINERRGASTIASKRLPRSGPRRSECPPSTPSNCPVIHVGLRADEETDGTRNVVDGADPAEGHLGKIVSARSFVVGQSGGDVGGDQAGAHRVHSDAVATEFVGGVADEHLDGCLGHGVGAEVAVGEVPGDRRRGHDRSPAAFRHQGGGVFDDGQCADHVKRHGVVPPVHVSQSDGAGG